MSHSLAIYWLIRFKDRLNFGTCIESVGDRHVQVKYNKISHLFNAVSRSFLGQSQSFKPIQSCRHQEIAFLGEENLEVLQLKHFVISYQAPNLLFKFSSLRKFLLSGPQTFTALEKKVASPAALFLFKRDLVWLGLFSHYSTWFALKVGVRLLFREVWLEEGSVALYWCFFWNWDV